MTPERREALQRRYLSGRCHLFALALHRAYGWQMLALLDKSERYAAGVFAVNHVYALDTKGGAWDALGRHSAKEVRANWMHREFPQQKPGCVAINDEDDLRAYVEATATGWSRPLSWYNDAQVARAWSTARLLLGHVLPEQNQQPGNTTPDEETSCPTTPRCVPG
jgi:hypothetical protein